MGRRKLRPAWQRHADGQGSEIGGRDHRHWRMLHFDQRQLDRLQQISDECRALSICQGNDCHAHDDDQLHVALAVSLCAFFVPNDGKGERKLQDTVGSWSFGSEFFYVFLMETLKKHPQNLLNLCATYSIPTELSREPGPC